MRSQNDSDFKKLTSFFLKVFCVTVAFTIDIKVRADTRVTSNQGPVEIEASGSVLNELPAALKLQEPYDAQTFEKGTLAVETDLGVRATLAEKTFVSFQNKNGADFFLGQAWFKIQPQTKKAFKIRTPQGEIYSQGGEFLIHVTALKTNLTVIAGTLEMRERSRNYSQTLHAGEKIWLGGLLADGRHAWGRIEAADLDDVMELLGKLAYTDPQSLQAKRDEFMPVWNKAVAKIADFNQKQVNRDMQSVEKWDADFKRKQEADRAEQLKIKKMFRARVLGVPDLDQ